MEFDWERAANWVGRVLVILLGRPIEPGLFYNVNLPHLRPAESDPEVVFCPLDPHPLPLSYRPDEENGLYYSGDYQARRRTLGADVDVCFGGRDRGDRDSAFLVCLLLRSWARSSNRSAPPRFGYLFRSARQCADSARLGLDLWFHLR